MFSKVIGFWSIFFLYREMKSKLSRRGKEIEILAIMNNWTTDDEHLMNFPFQFPFKTSFQSCFSLSSGTIVYTTCVLQVKLCYLVADRYDSHVISSATCLQPFRLAGRVFVAFYCTHLNNSEYSCAEMSILYYYNYIRVWTHSICKLRIINSICGNRSIWPRSWCKSFQTHFLHFSHDQWSYSLIGSFIQCINSLELTWNGDHSWISFNSILLWTI